MGSSKVFMCGPEQSMAQPENVLTLLHGPGRPRKWDLGPLWSWHWTCLGTAQERDSREPRNVRGGSQCCCRAGRAAALGCLSQGPDSLRSLVCHCVSGLRHSLWEDGMQFQPKSCCFSSVAWRLESFHAGLVRRILVFQGKVPLSLTMQWYILGKASSVPCQRWCWWSFNISHELLMHQPWESKPVSAYGHE